MLQKYAFFVNFPKNKRRLTKKNSRKKKTLLRPAKNNMKVIKS